MAKKKEKKEYTLQKKRSGRYAVIGKDGKYINGDAKVEILTKEKILKPKPVKKKKEEPAEEGGES